MWAETWEVEEEEGGCRKEDVARECSWARVDKESRKTARIEGFRSVRGPGERGGGGGLLNGERALDRQYLAGSCLHGLGWCLFRTGWQRRWAVARYACSISS